MAMHTENYKGMTISIHADADSGNPCEEWDGLGTRVCSHPRYNLGSEQASVEEIEEIASDPQNIVLPLYLLDHSGLSISTGSFGCPWDSGQVGIIYVPKEKVRSEYKAKRISAKLLKNILTRLEGQVETYDDYLTGNVWSFIITDADGEEVDSCWGFYGDYDEKYGALAEARAIVTCHNRHVVKVHIAKLKQWIKGKVAIQYLNPCPVGTNQ